MQGRGPLSAFPAVASEPHPQCGAVFFCPPLLISTTALVNAQDAEIGQRAWDGHGTLPRLILVLVITRSAPRQATPTRSPFRNPRRARDKLLFSSFLLRRPAEDSWLTFSPSSTISALHTDTVVLPAHPSSRAQCLLAYLGPIKPTRPNDTSPFIWIIVGGTILDACARARLVT